MSDQHWEWAVNVTGHQAAELHRAAVAAARHLRRLPETTEFQDVQVAEALEAAANVSREDAAWNAQSREDISRYAAQVAAERDRLREAVKFALAFLSEDHKTIGSHCGVDFCGACGAKGNLQAALGLTGHAAYADPIGGGWKGYRGACHDCDWTGPHYGPTDDRSDKDAAREDARAHADETALIAAQEHVEVVRHGDQIGER